MNKKIFGFLFAIIVFIVLFLPQKALADSHCGDGYPECANDCTACWVNSDCSYGGCWEDTNCGNCYVPPPPPACEPFTECRRPTYSDNWCCNNVNQSSTDFPKGNNVCNWEYTWYWNSSCECVRRGDAESRGHDCTTRPACGICLRGQTETETRFNTNCATSTCGGGNQTCAQEVDRQERNRTCNDDCGGWRAWSDWCIVDSYPQCPSNNSCPHTDNPADSTDANCGGQCSAPPPPPPPPPPPSSPPNPPGCTSISLTVSPNTVNPNSSLEFRVNSSYAYQNTNINMGGGASETGFGCCDPQYTWRWFARSSSPGNYTARFSGFKPGVGTCTATASYTVSGGSCNVSWSVSNPNPPANSFIQVKVRGLSDSQGWSNVGLYLDNTPSGSWGGIENPWPTFVYNNVPAGAGGGHTLQFRTNNGSRACVPTQTFTTQSTTPTNLAVTGVPSCASSPYNATFNWQNTNSTLWLDIADNPGFNGLANKNVSNLTTTTSAGFTLTPGITYYWRLWNGSVHTTGPSFSAPSCVPPTPTVSTPSCIVNGNNGSGINISWAAASPAVSYVDISPDNFTASFSNKAVSSTSTTGSGFSNGLTFNPNTPYYVRTWNGYAHNNAPNPSFSIPLCVPAAPTGLASACPDPGNSANLSWTASPNATSYNLTATGFPVTSVPGTTKALSTTSGNNYSWSVSACNSAGCSTATAGTGFTCTPPACPPSAGYPAGGLGACGDYLPTPKDRK